MNDNDWASVNDSTATYYFAGPLAPGDADSVDITLTVDLDYQDSLQVNFAEIQDATDRPGGVTKPDRDSEPDADRGNDTGGEPDGLTDNEIGEIPPTDEDDHDPASIKVHQIFDLALKKTLAPGQGNTVTWLDSVDYEITVYNQGTLHAYDIEIADYVPDSMLLADADWMMTVDTAFETIDTLLARDSVKFNIRLAVNQLFRGDTLVNYAEIAFASQESGSGINSPDEDSTPDSDDTNDGGGGAETPADDYVDGMGGGAPGSGTPATDEDDHDPAFVNVVPCSLFVTDVQFICQGETFDFNGTPITSTGSYLDTLTAVVHDCDSIITLNLTVLDTSQTIMNIDICKGDTLPFNGLELTAAGTFRDTLKNLNNCDSFIVLNLSVLDTFRTIQYDTICTNKPYPFGGNNLTTTGVYIDSLNAENGCDSIIELHLVVKDCDWGDLPDLTGGENATDYQTTESNGGPFHYIIPGLSLGSTIDNEFDGQPEPLANGDGVDEDGLGIVNGRMDTVGTSFTVPLTVTNTTGMTAYVQVWVDWNGDGDFNDSGESFPVMNDSGGSFPANLIFNIPITANHDVPIGIRTRLSFDENLTPYGQAEEGEIEDYMLRLVCIEGVCVPIRVERISRLLKSN